MKKIIVLTLSIILCGAGYFLFKGNVFIGESEQNKIIEMPESEQPKTLSPNDASTTSESSRTAFKHTTEDERGIESPIHECKAGWGDRWKLDEQDLLSEPDAVRDALKISTAFSAQFAYALSYVDIAAEPATAKKS